MKSTVFAVGSEPYILWEEDVAERTKDFLGGLDPEFFSHLLHCYIATEDEKRASVAIRLALHHATETMFSLLGALIQAPDCPYAWIARCSNAELRTVVSRISEGDASLASKFKLQCVSWDGLSALVFDTFEKGTARQKVTVQGFAKLWSALAQDFRSEPVIDEYNATKHGFRTRPGGFKIEIGAVQADDVSHLDAKMQVIGESQFGAMFYKVEKLDGKGGRHLFSRRIATNWSLQRDTLLLQLTQLSIGNAITRLKIANGFLPSTCKFQRRKMMKLFPNPGVALPG